MTTQPAFTTVAARQTLAKPAAPKATNFSQAVVDYVQRAFFEFNRLKDSPAFATITDTDVRAKLASIVNGATADGTISDRDWSTYPLPHHFLLEERQQAALHVTQDSILANINHAADPQTNGAHIQGIHESRAALLNGGSASGVQSRKRKSPDPDPTDGSGRPVTPPWKKKNNTKPSLADRITGKSKNQEKKRKDNGNAGVNGFETSEDALQRRRQRFGNLSPEPSPYHSSRGDTPVLEAKSGPIVGTCQTLEKSYFRLTAPPNPSTVRPLPVLEKALAHVLGRWKDEHDYTYVCDQMKSLRQDLTVQRIKTPFTIKVYEMHARIALQQKDLGEYNQCQTQLRALYKMRLGEGGSSGGKQDEFTAYRILYLIYTRSRTDMNSMLADLTTQDKKGPFVQLALRVRAALASGNYHKFFQLYGESQDKNMVPYLMDMFIERERLAAMAAICKAYKPDVSSKFLVKELAFDYEENDLFEGDVHRACLEFVSRYSGQQLLQEKDDDVRVFVGKAGTVFETAKQQAFGRVDIKGQI